MSNPLRVQMSGPLSAFAAGFRDEMEGRGYRPGAVAKQLQLMAHVSRWLAAHELEPAALDREQIAEFVAERRTSHTHLASVRGLEALLGHLRALGVVPPEGSREAATPAGELLDRYADYLRLRRGLKASTIRNYTNHARDFLADRERRLGGPALGTLNVAAVNDYMLRESRRVSVSSTQAAAGVLRSFLGFLHVEGVIDRDLAVAVPTVAKWRLASLVRAVDPALLARLLGSCDRVTTVGRRDFAILTLLSRLGLRIGEVAALRLGDLDWRAGELVINGKGERQERLPLPVDVGEAIVDWLHEADRTAPAGSSLSDRGTRTSGFTRPHSTPWSRARASERERRRPRRTSCDTRLRPRCCAPARACARSAQVLRHRGSEGTSIYAKVDRRALAALVQPWPGVLA
jgi:site-specific recombinase XerC